MLQLAVIRANPNEVIRRLAKKQVDAGAAVEQICSLDELRKQTQKEHDELLSRINTASKEVGLLMKEGKNAEADQIKETVAGHKEESKMLAERLAGLEKELHDTLVRLPNLPAELVPEGREPKDNVLVKRLACDVFITADQVFEHEHNLKSLPFGIVIVHVTRNKITFYRPLFAQLLNEVATIRAGEVVHVYGPPAD